MSSLKLRSDISCGLYGFNTDNPLLVVDLLYSGCLVAFEDDAAKVLRELINGKSIGILLDEIRCSSKENGEMYAKQTESFLSSVLPLMFEGFKSDGDYIFQRNTPSDDRSVVTKLQEGHYLYEAICELTCRCQLDCVHCYNSDHHDNGDLDTDHWIDILNQLRENGVYSVTLTGGDPFIRKDIWTIIEHIRSLSMSFDVYTNGQALACRENAERLCDLHPHSVQCSIYGATQKKHDLITRTPNSFKKTIQCLRFFQEFNVPVAIKTPILTLNENEILEINKLAKGLGAAHQIDIDILPKMNGDFSPVNLRISDDNMVKTFLQEELSLYRSIDQLNPLVNSSKKTEHSTICFAGHTTICILRDGSVTPCITFPFVLGNMKESPLNEILNGERMNEWKAATLGKRKGKCVACPDSKICNFCPGHSYVEKRDYLVDNSYDCQITLARKKALYHLKHKECPIAPDF